MFIFFAILEFLLSLTRNFLPLQVAACRSLTIQFFPWPWLSISISRGPSRGHQRSSFSSLLFPPTSIWLIMRVLGHYSSVLQVSAAVLLRSQSFFESSPSYSILSHSSWHSQISRIRLVVTPTGLQVVKSLKLPLVWMVFCGMLLMKATLMLRILFICNTIMLCSLKREAEITVEMGIIRRGPYYYYWSWNFDREGKSEQFRSSASQFRFGWDCRVTSFLCQSEVAIFQCEQLTPNTVVWQRSPVHQGWSA